MADRRFPLLTVLAAAALAWCALAAPALAQRKEAPKNDGGPKLAAPHAILIEAKSGSVLYERDADMLIYPASLGKLMTAEYVFHLLKIGKIHLTDEYPVSEHAWRTGGAPSHTSTMFAALNSKVPVDELLHGMIIQSANDACIVLAEAIAGNETQVRRAAHQARARDRAGEIDLRQFQRPAQSGRAGHHAASSPCSRAISSSTIRNSIRSSNSRTSPGTRSTR